MTFDRIAIHYDWMEALLAGSKLDQARMKWLNDLSGRQNILSMGEGHGRFARACVKRWPQAELTCIDASARMLERAQQKLHTIARTHMLTPRVTWNVADVLAWEPPPAHFDALVTCFFLDCFPPESLELVIARLAGGARRDAVWLVTDFAVPERGLRRWRASAVHALMYAFFRCAVGLPARRLTPPDRLLQKHGFALERRAEFECGLLRADVWRRRS